MTNISTTTVRPLTGFLLVNTTGGAAKAGCWDMERYFLSIEATGMSYPPIERLMTPSVGLDAVA
jgi:hypothetical protein